MKLTWNWHYMSCNVCLGSFWHEVMSCAYQNYEFCYRVLTCQSCFCSGFRAIFQLNWAWNLRNHVESCSCQEKKNFSFHGVSAQNPTQKHKLPPLVASTQNRCKSLAMQIPKIKEIQAIEFNDWTTWYVKDQSYLECGTLWCVARGTLLCLVCGTLGIGVVGTLFGIAIFLELLFGSFLVYIQTHNFFLYLN